jgi:hypothetical protein
LALHRKVRAVLYTLLLAEDKVTMFKASMFLLEGPAINDDDDDDEEEDEENYKSNDDTEAED